MSTETAPRAVMVGERSRSDGHVMVVMTVEPGMVETLRAAVDEVLEGHGFWCGPAAAGRRCRDALLRLVSDGGIVAEVVDAESYDDSGQARAECLAKVVELADVAGAGRVVLVRDDTSAVRDSTGSEALARRAGASPTLGCEHADADGEPLTVLADFLVWSWTEGGATRRAVAPAFCAVQLV